jgi:two-component system phosphate regulon response regulator OmpR
MATINALFVDDDQTVPLLAECVLKKRGIKVFGAGNTLQADSILRRERVDVILLDVLMAGENGLAYCQRLRQEGKRVPVMFLSAMSDPVTVRQGLSSGAIAYLVKPFDIYELEKRIVKLMPSSPSSTPRGVPQHP